MSFKERYKQAKVEYKALYVNLFVCGGLFVLSTPLFFFNLMEYSLGLLLGFIIGICNQLLLIHQMYSVIHANKPKIKGMFNYLLRFLLYGIGIALALFLSKMGYNIFNVFTVVGGYLVPIAVLAIVGLIDARRESNEKVS